MMHINHRSIQEPVDRRRLLARLSTLTDAGFVDNAFAARALANARDLGHLAAQPPSAEGSWSGLTIDGTLPRDLNGSLYRVAPGSKINHGVPLRHYFDGDAFVTKYQLQDGNASVRAHFVATPQRTEEATAGVMLYNEFGTAAPTAGRGGKNQPSINVIRWDGRVLALSEGGHPSALDPETLAFQQHWDFHGTLPADVSFTAHPKFDPTTGIGYAFGTHQAQDLALVVFRMELDGRLIELARLPQADYFMVHDMLLGREHIALVVPPVHFDIQALFSRHVSAAEALRYTDNSPTRVIVIRKDGTGSPTVFDLPPCVVFHHGNLVETDNELAFTSLMSPDDSVLRFIAAWTTDRPEKPRPTELTRIALNMRNGSVASRTVLSHGDEFPRFDTRLIGQPARYLYTTQNGEGYALQSIHRHDLQSGASLHVAAGAGYAFEETIFVPRDGATGEDQGWLLHQGYSAERDETLLDVRDAATLERAARIWTGQHFPLGLHGNFYGHTE